MRYCDAPYGDDHPWNHKQVVYYNRWETETHRDRMDFKNRAKDEQNRYWKGRHARH